MFRTLAVLFFLLKQTMIFAQPSGELQPLLDSSLSKMQQYSLNRNKTDWVEFKKKAYARTKGISQLDSLLDKYPLFFEWLNDFHGGIQYHTKFFGWAKGHQNEKNNPALDSVIKKSPFLRIERKNDLVYYRVPGGTTKNVAAVTQMLADSLCKTEPATAKAFIIDLRLNTGGNIWFNLSSLAFLIGEGTVTGYKYINGEPDKDVVIKQGKVFGNDQWYSIPEPKCTLSYSNVPVVLIVGPKTASSAEGLLLAFKGRPNTLIIGEATAGLVTANNTYPLRKDLTLVLAISHMKDRKGNFYTSPIQPDILIEGGDDFSDLEKDKKVIAALNWINKNK